MNANTGFSDRSIVEITTIKTRERYPCGGMLLEVLMLLTDIIPKLKSQRLYFCLENGDASVNTRCMYSAICFSILLRCTGADCRGQSVGSGLSSTTTRVSHISDSLCVSLPQTKQLLPFWYPGAACSDATHMKMIC